MNLENIVSISPEERVASLVHDINSAGKGTTMRIVGGEADCAVYGKPAVVEALKDAKKRNINIQMIVGPVVFVDEEKRKNIILELYQEGVLQLFYRSYRHEILHYRIVETKSSKNVYVEAPHAAGGENIDHKFIKLDNHVFWADKLSEDFDRLIKSNRVKKVTNPEKDLLLLSPSQVARLFMALNKAGKDYDFLSKDEISDYLKKEI